MAAARAAKPGPLVSPGRVPLLYLDANVLLPEYLRAVILDLADAELVRVHWGEQVLAEVQRNLLKPKLGTTPASVDKLLRDMRNAFPDALLLGSEALEPEFEGKTDPKDAHVAAGALKLSRRYGGQPVLLVTGNIRHLPEAASGTRWSNPCGPVRSWRICWPCSPPSPTCWTQCSGASRIHRYPGRISWLSSMPRTPVRSRRRSAVHGVWAVVGFEYWAS